MLVDAPCSSSGVLRRHPGLRWGGAWAEGAAWDGAKGVWLDAAAGGGGAAAGGAAAGGVIEDALPALQSSLLRQAARYVRPGGRLVYATCSLDPAENGAVAEAFERQVHEIGAARADLGDLAFAPWPFAAGVAGREATRPHHRTLWPHRHDTDGFFVARWRRLEN